MKSPLFVAAFCAAVSLTSAAFAQDFKKPVLLGEIVLPTGLQIKGVEFGGVSGLDYDAAQDIYYAISDDRSEKAPARFYTLRIVADEKGLHSVDILSTVTLLNADGKPFANKDVDPESIRYHAGTGTLFWTSEGDRNGKPAVRESRIDGSLIREFALPDYYIPNADGTRGIRNNLSFESLTFSPDGKTLLVGLENALLQDGDKATLEKGCRARILAFDILSGGVKAEYAYDTGPIFTKATKLPYWNDNGMSEFLAWGDDLLTVERSYAHGVGNEINFYRARFAGATDVSGMATLKDVSLTPMAKEAVLRLGEGDFGLDIDNIESVSWGPTIGGHKTVVIASDNNFNLEQFTQFVLFQLNAEAN